MFFPNFFTGVAYDYRGIDRDSFFVIYMCLTRRCLLPLGFVEGYGELDLILGSNVFVMYPLSFVWKHFAVVMALGVMERLVGMGSGESGRKFEIVFGVWLHKHGDTA